MAYHSGLLDPSSMCPHERGTCNSGVWTRGVPAIQGSGLEGCLQFRGLD